MRKKGEEGLHGLPFAVVLELTVGGLRISIK